MIPEEKPKRFKIATLGCRTNQYESQAFQDQLLAMGYLPAEENETADICIVNTCTVTESADKGSRHEIRQLVKHNPGARVVVTGCSAERQPDVIQQIAGVTDVVSNKDKENLLNIVYPEEQWPEFSIKRFEAHTRAFLKVQDGCNSYCTYCIIPYVRGRSRSKALDEVLKEAKELISNGFKEIVLTGINIGDFDGGNAENPVRLAELVREVDKLPGLERLRVSSIDPDEVDFDLADAILNGAKTCPSMHIVLQSGSNVILKRMNRKYTRQIFQETIEKLWAANPDFTYTTDVIVGFPGETETDHEDTLEMIRLARFAKVHMFPYSSRPRTRAALMPNHVPQDIIQRRKQEVLRLSEQVSFDLRQAYVGRILSVLTESKDAATGKIGGHTANFLQVWIEGAALEANTLVDVKLIANTPDGLVGKLVE
ncbi:MAG: tRNA (N(6)-L-threonylcarbamoyladenosine(37)-C(2))-methylthiotransferase MtaB [Parachlamydiales bacterium]|jgi:threonylcarbamoyladenosine tRNA methylthiotransferase MtaB